ncbi:MAG TPA: GNAT family N-acetyltransferase [Xanthobacteraceae bacterium]|jgi:GNAT superfamily N-acetyltransferase|nr:GNAT family N-acetyltransferase [Xanthobacteraceae bacterium]
MDIADIQIRRLGADEAEKFRDIRLESLRCNPEAFGSSFAAESVKPASWFADRLSTSFVLGAFRTAVLLGIAALVIQQGDKRAHKGLLVGMYVRPDARRAGVGRRLVEAIVALARDRVELIQLSVVKEMKRRGGCMPVRGSWSTGSNSMPSSKTAATTMKSSWRRTSR